MGMPPQVDTAKPAPVRVSPPPPRTANPSDVLRQSDIARGERLTLRYAQMERSLRARGKLRTSGIAATPPKSAEDLARNFIDIAFFQEYGSDGAILPANARGETTLHRWSGPVRLALTFGDSIPEDRRQADKRMVSQYVYRLARLTGLKIDITTADRANFHVIFANEPDRRVLLADDPFDLSLDTARALRNLDPRNFCAVVTSGSRLSGRIRHAVAIIRDENPPRSRISCVHEELAQGLGLLNDSPDAEPSIFNDDDTYALLTRHDELLLQILYDPRLRSGMTREEASPIITQIAQELMRETS